MSNANNTMSSLSVSNQHSTMMNKDRKSIDVVKKSNVLSNLIYKPVENNATNAIRNMTYHSISP